MNNSKVIVSEDTHIFHSKAIEIILIALIILTPLVFYPYLIRMFNVTKEMVYSILVVIALAFWAFKSIEEERVSLKSNPLNVPITAFMFICIASIVWSDNPWVSLQELPLFLAGPLLFFVIVNNINSQKQIERLVYSIIFVGALFGLYGILQYLGIDFSIWQKNVGRQKVFGLFGNVNYFAEYLIIPLSIAVSQLFSSGQWLKKILLLIAVVAMGTTLLLTFTRSSYLGFAFALIIIFSLFLSGRKNKFLRRNKKGVIIFVVIALMFSLLFFIPNPLNKEGTPFFKIKERVSISKMLDSYSIKRRLSTWGFTLLMIRDNPLLGSGIGTFQYNTLRYQARFLEENGNRSKFVYGIADKAHNEYLQLWAELGIVGLAICLWLFISFFLAGIKFLKNTKNDEKKAIMIGFIGATTAVLIDSLFSFPLHLPATVFLFWLTLGLSISIIGMDENEKQIYQETISQNQKTDSKKGMTFYLFKIFSYIAVILLTLSLCLMLIRPFMSQVYEYYGVQNSMLKKNEETVENLQKALKWNPYYGMVYYHLGYVLTQRDLNTPALKYFEMAEKYMDHPKLPEMLSHLYLKKGQTDKGIEKLKLAITYQRRVKDMIPLYNDLANIYSRLKKYELAEDALKNALEIDDENVKAHNGLAFILIKQNKKEEAIIELKKVIELAPESNEGKYARAAIRQLSGEK